MDKGSDSEAGALEKMKKDRKTIASKLDDLDVLEVPLDLRYNTFEMPKTCKSVDDCEWICDNLIAFNGAQINAFTIRSYIQSAEDISFETLWNRRAL